MTLTEKDLEKFNEFWKKLEKISAERWERYTNDVMNPVLIKELNERLEKLEKLFYFILMSLAQEGFIANELREALKRTDWYNIYREWGYE